MTLIVICRTCDAEVPVLIFDGDPRPRVSCRGGGLYKAHDIQFPRVSRRRALEVLDMMLAGKIEEFDPSTKD